MKRTFLKVALLSSLMLSMPLAFTSCKDYDDDINTNKEAIADLKAEMANLKTALEKAQADADAAKAAAAAASDEAAKARAYADQAAAEAKADAIKQAMDAVKELEGKTATKADLEALKGQVEAIETGLSTIKGDMDTVKNTLTQLQIQLDAVEKYKALIDQNSADIEKCNKAITELQDLVKSLQAKVDSMASTENVEAAKQELKKYCDDAIAAANATVSAINKNLVTLLTTQLRSVVFIPNIYIDGIEACAYDYVTFQAMTSGAGTINQNNHEGQTTTVLSPATDWNWSKSVKTVEIDPVNYVEYNINPTSAVVRGEDISFLSNDATKLDTRAGSATPVAVADQVSTTNGVLKVGYTVVGSKILKTYADEPGKASIFALVAKVPNMTVGDETTTVGSVSSDWAMLYPDEYTPLALAFNSNTYPAQACPTTALPNDLWPTLKDCIANAPSVPVQWDKTLDLNKIVATHYASTADLTSHKVWNEADLAKYGFTYDFFPIQYTVGSNKTSDTQFIQQDLSAGIVTPCGVTAAGVADNTPTRASIGKNPIVRVRLLDASKNVALVGFIKLNITEEAAVPEEPIVVDPGVDMGPAAFNCNGFEDKVDWAYITHYIIQTLEISKEQFDADYKLATSATDTQFQDVNQYQKSGNTFTLVSNKYGKVGLVVNETGATTTVIDWNLTVQDLQRIYELDNETVTIYVKYENIVDPMKAAVYVPLTITKVTKPEGTVVNKAVSVWHRNGEVNLFNVPQPTFGGKPSPFKMDLDNAWYSGTTVQKVGPVLSDNTVASQYNKFVYYLTAANNNVSIADVYCADGSKKTFTLTVSSTKNQALLTGSSHQVSAANMGKHALLYAPEAAWEYNNNVLKATAGGVTMDIATLDQTTGELVYVENDFSKALLNHYASTSKTGDDPADRTNAQLGISIGLCYYNSCNIALKLTNGIYNGFFLRPINVATNGEPVFQDAHENGSTIYLYDMLTFSDWRYFNFVGQYRWLFAYYGVQGVTVDTANIKSNYAGVMGVNPAVNEHFVWQPGTSNGSIAYPTNYNNNDASNADIETLVRNAFGTLTWNNQDLTVKSFDVEIPVKVTYYWGTINNITLNAKVVHTYQKRK